MPVSLWVVLDYHKIFYDLFLGIGTLSTCQNMFFHLLVSLESDQSVKGCLAKKQILLQIKVGGPSPWRDGVMTSRAMATHRCSQLWQNIQPPQTTDGNSRPTPGKQAKLSALARSSLTSSDSD